MISVRQVAEKLFPLDDDIYFISFNGARVATALSDRHIFRSYLSRDDIRDIAAIARQHNMTLNGYRGREFVAEAETSWVTRYAASTDMTYSIVPNLDDALPEGSPKLLAMGEAQNMVACQKSLNDVAAGRWRTTNSKPNYIEIVRPDVDKGRALKLLIEHLGIAASEVCAVGDSLNDREMLTFAGLGIAVANARDEVKAVADYVTQRTAEEGALEEVRDLFFGERP